MPSPLRAEIRAMLRLAVPTIVVQLGIMGLGTVDTIMLGRYSTVALDAVALGNMCVWAFLMLGIGVLLAVEPIVAQGVGAADPLAVSRGVQRGVVLALGLAVPITLLHLAVGPLLALCDQPAELVPVAQQYAVQRLPAALPLLLFELFRKVLQAKSRLRVLLVAIVVANAVHALLDWVLIYGRFGLPALGVRGAAYATVVSAWLLLLLLVAGEWRELRSQLVPFRRDAFALRPLLGMLALGAPIAAQMQLEGGVFWLTGLLMSRFGLEALGGHQAALNLASNTFMVPLGLSMAAAVRVGYGVGAGDRAAVGRSIAVALGFGVAVMAVFGAVFLCAPYLLASIFSHDARVLAVAAALIPIAGVFQVFDGLQVVCIGILRGLSDTKTPLVVNLLGFWVLGAPVAILLSRTELAARGLWWGLVVGLAIVALVLLARIRARLRAGLQRVTIDAATVEP
jgi:MATE family multidrug resistance protein